MHNLLLNDLFETGLYMTTHSQPVYSKSKLPILEIPAGHLVVAILQFSDGYSLCEIVETKQVGLIESKYLYRISPNQIIFIDSAYEKDLKLNEYNQEFLPVWIMLVDERLRAFVDENVNYSFNTVIRDSKINDCLENLAMNFQTSNIKKKIRDSGILLEGIHTSGKAEISNFEAWGQANDLIFSDLINDMKKTDVLSDSPYSNVASIITPQSNDFAIPEDLEYLPIEKISKQNNPQSVYDVLFSTQIPLMILFFLYQMIF
jgi:hypothetical protein